MKSVILTSLVAVLATVVLSAEANGPVPKKLTPEQRAERKAAAKRRAYERTGGYIIQPGLDLRKLVLVNVDGVVDAAILEPIAKSMTDNVMVPTVVSSTRPEKAGFILEIKDTDYPATILTAPENGYAMLNVRMLKKDSPDAEKLKARLTKEVWRTMMLALGSGYDMQPKCLMKPVATLADLDALGSTCPCPQTFTAVSLGAERYGIRPERRVTYRTACQEGWAPTPTNDVQKKIWKEVHDMPKSPMKIEFDPKKGR